MAALLEQLDRVLRHGPSSPVDGGIDRRIATWLEQHDDASRPGTTLRAMVANGLDAIPLPGHGATLKRWQCLEQVARHDLALAKLYESHVDAFAILHEIDTGFVPRPGMLHAVWASESRVDPITIRDGAVSEPVLLDGRKSWCSGAREVDVGLMTATDRRGDRWLVEVRLGAAGISIDDSHWQAVGMEGSGSFDVACDGVVGRLVGHAGAYLDRPGFWQGGCGVAAVWYGAAAAIGTRVRDLQSGREDVHALAHLGAIDGALAAAAALLRETAAAVDAAPAADMARVALRVRGVVADLAEHVIHHATHAIGPGPLCNEPRLARLVADLPIFVRQCRAEHDLVAQSRGLLADPVAMQTTGWRL